MTLGAEHIEPLPAVQAGTSVLGWLAELNGSLHREFSLPVALLWGNAAAALAGVARVHQGPAIVSFANELLTLPPLAAHLSRGRRTTTCCLFYRVAEGALCGDCVFTTAPAQPHHTR